MPDLKCHREIAEQFLKEADLLLEKFNERKPGYTGGLIVDNVALVICPSWIDFVLYYRDKHEFLTTYVWRGQKNPCWKLRPTLFRLLKEKSRDERIVNMHLEKFKQLVKEKKEKGLLKEVNLSELKDDWSWWALGRHYGLATPILDWTYSPFIATFFAFEEMNNEDICYRAIFAIESHYMENDSEYISKNTPNYIKPIEFIRFELMPELITNNHRLIAQKGLFTKVSSYDVEKQINEMFGKWEKIAPLVKFLLPDSERREVLQTLDNQLGINHSEMFPDLNGISYFCNDILEMLGEQE